MSTTTLAWIALFSPAAAVVAISLAGNRISRSAAGLLAAGTTGLSFACTVVVFFQLLGRDPEDRSETSTLWTWLTAGDLRFDAQILVDPMSVFMMLVVSGVGFLILCYATGYMHGDDEERRYHAYKALFVFSMLLLVEAGNFLLLLAGWGMVGLSSYLLINFWHRRREAVAAGKKAFIMNAFGDATFVLALFILVQQVGSLDFGIVFARAPEALGDGSTLAVLVALGLLGGAVAKSAQVPLQTWLPDAMEGPTPVSALIHAATMVTAGVYLIARTSPLFELAGDIQDLAGILGAVTVLLAGLIALVQTDIKRVIAYSTMSQIGYMFIGVGLGAYGASLFHLMTHAFFKALLFMAAGIVIHALSDEQDIRRMGGLGRELPWTYRAFLVGSLALAAIPPFAGFFSKDAILSSAANSGGARLGPLERRHRRRVPHRPLHVPAPLHRLLRRDVGVRARAPAPGPVRGAARHDVAGRDPQRALDHRRLPPGAGRVEPGRRLDRPGRRVDPRGERSARRLLDPGRARRVGRRGRRRLGAVQEAEREARRDQAALRLGRPDSREEVLLRRGVQPRLLRACVRAWRRGSCGGSRAR